MIVQCFQKTGPALKHGETLMVSGCGQISVCVLYRRRGGVAEERAERQRWNEREHERIMRSVRGRCDMCQCYGWVKYMWFLSTI